jgi:hypothetical protein
MRALMCPTKTAIGRGKPRSTGPPCPVGSIGQPKGIRAGSAPRAVHDSATAGLEVTRRSTTAAIRISCCASTLEFSPV